MAEIIKIIKNYNPTLWEDEIVDIGDDGKPIAKLDEFGQIIKDIFGNTEWETIQEGTRINAKRMNNIEDGISNAHKWLLNNTNQMKRLQLQLEMTDRVPNSSGAFFDDFSGESNTRFIKDNTRTDLIESVLANTKVLKVASTVAFKELTEVTIFDRTNMEHVQIATINAEENTITIVNNLTNAYEKGAKICRSTAIEVDNAMEFGTFDLFSIEKVVQ